MKKGFIAIITARGGSIGIKKKNLKKINGHPLISYSIIAARKSKNIKRIFVTTDNLNIARVSKRYGAEIIKRPKNLSGDRIASEHALIHAIKYIEKKKINFSNIVFLQPTSVFRKKNDIDNAIKIFNLEKADSLFTSCDRYFFLWKKNDKKITPVNYNFNKRKRRQELPSQYIENGSFYITKKNILTKRKNRLGGKISTYIMNSLSLFEIDSKDDLKIVSLIFSSGIAKREKIIMP